MAAKKPGAQATVTLKHLAANLSESHEMSKKQTEALLGELVDLVTKHLKKGDRIRIGGLGILVVRKRAARMGRNPATGEPIQIKASKKVAFRAAKELKEAVAGKARSLGAIPLQPRRGPAQSPPMDILLTNDIVGHFRAIEDGLPTRRRGAKAGGR